MESREAGGGETGVWILIAGLPYDVEVKWLESTGTQYIVLPTTAGQCYGFDLSVTDVATTGYNVYVGNGTTNDSCVGVDNGNINSSYIRIRTTLTFSRNTGAAKQISAKNGTITVNGSNIGTYDASLPLGNNNNAMAIFAYSFGSFRSICRVMSYKLYGANWKLLLDVIPVRFMNELGQSEGAMYDHVSHKLFRNQGTGSFVIGPDVAMPIMGLHFMKSYMRFTARDYVQNGLIAMWDGIENAGWGIHVDSLSQWNDLIGGFLLQANNGVSGDFSNGHLHAGIPFYNGAGDPVDKTGIRYYEPAIAVKTYLNSGLFTIEIVFSHDTSSLNSWQKSNYLDFGLGLVSSHSSICFMVNGDVKLKNGVLASGTVIESISVPDGTRASRSLVIDKDSLYASIYGSGAFLTSQELNSGNAWGQTDSIVYTNTCVGNVDDGSAANTWSYDKSLSSSSNIYSIRIYSRPLLAAEIFSNYIIDK